MGFLNISMDKVSHKAYSYKMIMLLYAKSFSCVWLCDPMWLCDPCDLYDLCDCKLPGSPFHGISQARILEWDTISYSSTKWLFAA